MSEIRAASPRVVLRVLHAFVLATPLAAQCDLEWREAGGYPGANAVVRCATAWDPDGPGPAASTSVFGGDFTIFGTAVASRIVAYDAATNRATPIGTGIDGSVHAVLALPNGHLVAAGAFNTAGGVLAANLARFDGTSWSAPFGAITGTVHALAMLPNGDLVAAGWISAAGGTPAVNIARWDGAMWSPLGAGVTGAVRALAVAPNGDLIAGGDFTSAGGVSAARIARWSNGTWHPLGGGCNSHVRGVAVLPSGEVFAAGAFTQAGGNPAAGVAMWDGFGWSDVSPMSPGEFGQSLSRLASGALWLGTQGSGSLYRWTGASFQYQLQVLPSSSGSGSSTSIHAVTIATNGDVLVAGDFRASGNPWTTPRPRETRRVLRLVASQPIGIARIDTPVAALARTANGVAATGRDELDALGTFDRHIDVWNGTDWDVFAIMSGPGNAMAGLADGRVLAIGSFQTFGTSPPFGTPWTRYHSVGTFGSGPAIYALNFWSTFQQQGTALTPRAEGGYVMAMDASGYSSLLTLDEAGGLAPGSVQAPGLVACLASTTGSVYAGGNMAGGNCVRWDGTQWQSLGVGVDGTVRTLLLTRHGELIAGGEFTNAGGAPASRIARWNGTTWSPLGSGLDGTVLACLELPNGDLLVGGTFTTAGGAPATNLARWNGTTWSAIAGGTNGTVRALLLASDGTVWVGGDFTIAGNVAGHVARLVTPCPAAVVSVGTGCIGSGGANALVATSLPWLGSAFASRATGMPGLGLVVQVNGLVPFSVPLAAILPWGAANCTLLTTPDVLDVYLPVNGAVDMQLALPMTSVSVGQTIFQQVVPLELDGGGSILSTTSSNALRLTVGGL